jgi:Type I phosphodiesterase / nucleotide pyrophosphatase
VQPDPSAELVAECSVAGLPGIVPSARRSLAAVPGLLLGELDRARRGVVVLAADGVSYRPGRRHWPAVTPLTSVFPSVSATAWLTATTGASAAVHGVPGMVYRLPGRGLVLSVSGRLLADPAAAPAVETVAAAPRTVFERARARGCGAVAVGREIDALPGPWPPAVLRGADRPRRHAALTTDPLAAAAAAVADVDRLLPAARRPTLVWAYVNLDDDQHAHGWGQAGEEALDVLAAAAARWADQGWTVVAHSDHGHVPAEPDPDLDRAWAAVDRPELCTLPAGGAGRTRWLHPRPGREDEVAGRLAEALGDSAVVLGVEELPRRLLPLSPVLRERLGAVVAIATGRRFPLPDPAMSSEHGATHPDEMLVPYAVWRP